MGWHSTTGPPRALAGRPRAARTERPGRSAAAAWAWRSRWRTAWRSGWAWATVSPPGWAWATVSPPGWAWATVSPPGWAWATVSPTALLMVSRWADLNRRARRPAPRPVPT